MGALAAPGKTMNAAVWIGVLVALAVAAVAVGVLLRHARRRGAVAVTLIPVACAPWGRIRLEVTNTGTAPLYGLEARIRPAPPGIVERRIGEVVPTGHAERAYLMDELAPGASAAVELESPLRPGPLYRRVLGVAPDDDEPVYGLPIETLLAVALHWYEPSVLVRPRRRSYALVRGAR